MSLLTVLPTEQPAPGPGQGPPPEVLGARRHRDSALYGALILPGLLLVLFVIAYPLVLSIYQSIFKIEQGQEAYAWFADNGVYVTIMRRTLTTAMLNAAICLLLGYPYAYLIVVVGPRLRTLLTLLILVPFWVSGLVRIFAWVILLQTGGPIAKMFPFLGQQGLLHTQTAVQIGLAQVLLPFLILPLYNSLRTIDQRLMLAAESLGARRSVAFFRVFVPLSMPGIYAGTMLVFMLTLGFYVLPQILGSPSTSMIGSVIYTQTSTLTNVGRAGALSLVMLICAVAIVVAFWALTRLIPAVRRAS